VILGLIPKDIIWAGKIKNQKELLRMEVVSFLILGVAITIVTLKLELLTFIRSPKWIDGGVWGIFIFFTLNLDFGHSHFFRNKFLYSSLSKML
jgi:hypothetical protein